RFQTPIVDQQFLESLSWFRGQHALKFGAEYRLGANDEIRDRGSAGNFTISPLITDLPGSSSTTGNSLASFLLAKSMQPTSRCQTKSLRVPRTWRSTCRTTGAFPTA